MPKKNDFIIVGGGLVGCLASLILSKKNYSICLVEKKTFKRIISDDFTPLSLTINTIEFLKKSFTKKNNIYFAGIDFVSGYLIGDINITSPTGLKQYRELTGINLSKVFWNNLSKLK